jgi:TonB-dependent receptor-like protein
MIVTQHGGAGKANQYFLRGFNLDHGTDFATYLAGMPVNLRTHAHGQGYMDLNFMIPELVSRIDYDKGPYYAQQGDFATAGSANIHYAESLPNTLAEVGIGTEKYGRALIVGSPELGPGRVVYGIELYHDNGPWEHPDNYRKLNGVLRYTQKVGDGQWGVTAMGYSGKWNSTDQIAQRAVDAGLIDRLGAIDPSDGGRTYRYSLSGDYQKQFAGGQLQSTAYAIRYYLKLYSNFTYYLDDPVMATSSSNTTTARSWAGMGVGRGATNSRPGYDPYAGLGPPTGSPRPGRDLQHGAAAALVDQARGPSSAKPAMPSTPKIRRSGATGYAPSPVCAATATTSRSTVTLPTTPEAETQALVRRRSRSSWALGRRPSIL